MGSVGFNLEEVIVLNRKGELQDYSATVDIENRSGRKIEYDYVPARTVYQPGRLVRPESLQLIRTSSGRQGKAVLGEIGRQYFDEKMNRVDNLVYKFIFKENRTQLRPNDHLQFRTTLSYQPANRFRTWTSAWWAQPAWYQSIRDKSLLFSHRFGLRVPKPSNLMDVQFEPNTYPHSSSDLGNEIMYWWGPLPKKQTLEVSGSYNLKYSKAKVGKKVASVLLTVAAKLVRPV